MAVVKHCVAYFTVFTSAVVTPVSRWVLAFSACSSDCNPLSNFVNGHMSTVHCTVCGLLLAGLARLYLCSFASLISLNVSEGDLPGTVYDITR